MIISVFPNLLNNGVEDLSRDVFSVLSELNTEVYVSSKYKDKFSGCNVLFADDDEIMRNCDVAIAIGGDGTTLNVAKKAARYSKKVLGINAGRLGFMSGLEHDELDLLKNVVDGNYEIDERLMLEANIVKNGSVLSVHQCLNDAVISRGNFARLIDISNISLILPPLAIDIIVTKATATQTIIVNTFEKDFILIVNGVSILVFELFYRQFFPFQFLYQYAQLYILQHLL